MSAKQKYPTSVLLAVAPAAMMRVVEHLLGSHPNLEVVARAGSRDALAHAVVHTLPDIAIISERLLRANAREALAAVRRASSGTKVILIRAGWEFSAEQRDCGADACVREDALVRRLKSLLSRLSSQAGCTVH